MPAATAMPPLIFTSSGKACARVQAISVQAGMVGVNIGVAAPMAFFTFTGWKDSFFGDLHAHGRDAIEFLHREEDGHHALVLTPSRASSGPASGMSITSHASDAGLVFSKKPETFFRYCPDDLRRPAWHGKIGHAMLNCVPISIFLMIAQPGPSNDVVHGPRL